MLPKVTKMNQAMAGCIIAFGGFGYGCVLSWTATALPSLEKTGQAGTLTAKEKSWIGSLLAIGALIGCPVAGLLMNQVGRRGCLWCFSLIGFVGWLLLFCAVSPFELYIGRILTGAATGGYTIVIPVYVSEIASKDNRGLIGSLFLVMLCLGKLFSNVIGCVWEASLAALVCSIVPVLYSLLLLFVPESPVVLLRKNKVKNAAKTMAWLESVSFTTFPFFKEKASNNNPTCQSSFHGSAEQISTKLELIKIEMDKNKTKTSSLREILDLSSTEIIKPVGVVIIQMILSQICGINVSTFYTVEIFQISTGSGFQLDPKLATVILTGIQVLGCLPCSVFIERCGRRFLLISSYFAMAIGMGGFTVYFYLQENYPEILAEFKVLSLIPISSMIVYNLAYCWGVGSIVWIVMSEILPPKIIGPASSLANASFWGSAFVITQAFQFYRMEIALYFWFLFFTVACAAGCLFNLIFLPETKGLTLQEIQLFYKRESYQQSPL